MNANPTMFGKFLPWALSGLVALGLVLSAHPSFAGKLFSVSFQTEYFLNPDGSGKVKASLCVRDYDYKSGNPIRISREKLLREILSKVEHIGGFLKLEAVNDFEVHVRANGWWCRTFTGYFPRIKEILKDPLGYMPQSLMGYDLHREKDGLRLEAKWPLLDMYLSAFSDGLKKAKGKDEQEKWIEMIQGEWNRDLKGEDSLYRGLYRWRFEEVIHLPGRVKSASNFRREGENTLRILLGNWKLMAAFRVTHQEHVLREMAAANSTEPGRREAMKILFGADAPIEAIVAGPLEPLFDYSKEVAAAKAAMPAMLERLGIEAGKVTPKKE